MVLKANKLTDLYSHSNENRNEVPFLCFAMYQTTATDFEINIYSCITYFVIQGSKK
jgi:hypothetical protein